MTTTKTTTMTTRKLYGKDLAEYENMDVDDLLAQLTPEELDILSREVDPDVSFTSRKLKVGVVIVIISGEKCFCFVNCEVKKSLACNIEVVMNCKQT